MQNSSINQCHYSGLPSTEAYMNLNQKKGLSESEIDSVVKMAREETIPYEEINNKFGLDEDGVRALMKSNLSYAQYKLWIKHLKISSTQSLEGKNNLTDEVEYTLNLIFNAKKAITQ